MYQSSYNTCDFLLTRLWYFSYTSDICCALYQTCVQLSINIYSTRVPSLYTFLLLIQNLHYAFVQDFLFVFCCMLNKSSHLFSLKTIKQNNKGIPSKVFRNILIFSRENHAEFSFHFIFSTNHNITYSTSHGVFNSFRLSPISANFVCCIIFFFTFYMSYII